MALRPTNLNLVNVNVTYSLWSVRFHYIGKKSTGQILHVESRLPTPVLVKTPPGGWMFSKLDSQTFTSEFGSHCVIYSYGLVPHLSKKLTKLLSIAGLGTSNGVMVGKLDYKNI